MNIPYNFSVLRYIHDGVTQEFVNIGVVVFSAEQNVLKAKCSKTYSRISTMFERIDGRYFRDLVTYVESQLNDSNRSPVSILSERSDLTLDTILAKILPRDDSSIQFSSPGAGITNSLEHEVEALFARYVSHYVSHSEGTKKTSEKVWGKFRDALEKKSVINKLEHHKITTPNYEYEFKHAAKNGIWHVCEPISFDLSEAGAIVDKAISWVGAATTLAKSAEEFKLNLLIGRPDDIQLEPSYQKAKQLLKDIPMNKEIFEEHQTEEFADSLERDVLGHS